MRSNSSAIPWTIGLVCWIGLGLTGCSRWMAAPRFVQPEQPLSIVEQEKLVLDVVAPGDSPDEVERKLRDAGIEGEFSAGRSRFYAQSWAKPNGDRLLLDVDLLFDTETRHFAQVQPRGGFVTGTESAFPSAAIESNPSPKMSADERRRRRTPFVESLSID